MSVVSLQTFADYLATDVNEPGLQTFLDRAEVFLAAKLGATSIARRVITDKTYVQHGTSRGGLATGEATDTRHYFNDGPVTALEEVLYNGRNIGSDAYLHPNGWSMSYVPRYTSIPFDVTNYNGALAMNGYSGELTVRYQAGYASEYQLPATLLQYILLSAALNYSVPMGGVKFVQIGDSKVEVSTENLKNERNDLELLISRYKRLI